MLKRVSIVWVERYWNFVYKYKLELDIIVITYHCCFAGIVYAEANWAFVHVLPAIK